MKALRVLDDIRRLFSTKADNLSYNNGQLQLTADNKPIGLPLSIVTGGSINSFVSGVNNGIFIAPTDNVSTFTISDYQSSKIVTLIKENYVLVQNKDFSIDNAGLVTLSYPLEKDQFVAWVMMHTTYDYNDLANKPTIGSGGVSLKISETEPSTELVSGLVWYRPSTRSLAMYIETTGFIKLNSSEGEVQMFEQVFTAVAPTGVIDITIPDLNVRDVLLVDHDGATLYEGINYSINYTENKLNLIAHELKIGESIHIVCIRVSNGSTAVLDKAESIYTALEAGVSIVPINIIGFDTSQIYIVDHDGATLYEGVNYEVLPDMKHIQLLNFAMEAGERIHILNIKMISSEATKAILDDMRDKVTDNTSAIGQKVDKTSIINNLTTGGVTNVLSAQQGVALNSAIGQNTSKITALEGKINAPSYSAPTDATAPIISLPSTVVKGKLEGSIKGNTLYQAIVNGDFSNGPAGWYADATTMSALNKILSVTIKEEYNFTMASNVTNIDMIDSKKVFLKIRTRVTNPNCNRLRMFYNGSNNSSLAQLSVVATQSAPVSNQWYDLIGIATISTASGNTGKLRLAIYPDYPDGATAKGKVMEVDGNTGVFAIPITGTPYENLTADQINAMIGGYWEGLKGTREVGVKAIGKNLFDKKAKDNLANYYLSPTGGIILSSTNLYSMTGFVKVKPSSSYRQNIGANSSVYACYYDRNKNLISSQALNLGQITLNTPINCQYLRTTFINSYGTFDTLQIEEGTVATPYEPYTETELFAPVKLNRLPNNIADKFTMDGKYIQRTAEKTSQTGVVNYTDMATDGSFIAQLADGAMQTGIKGATLTATATKIIYQLATPIETQYPSTNLIAEASGSIYVDSTYSNAQYYDTGIIVSGRKLSSINKVTLINKVSGVEKDITSQCTLNVNKDGFTATGVLPTDLIWYSLELADVGILPTLSYSYPLNIAGAVSSNTESIKQIDERTDIIQSIVESQNYMYGDPVSEFENFDPINAQFLEGNPASYFSTKAYVDTKAPIASPTFTGVPSSVTPATGDNTTKIATTAFVNAEITNDRPYATTTTTLLNGGTGIVGTSVNVARADHTHTMPQSVLQSQVINDLTTGGIADVLSAEQGKTLNINKLDKSGGTLVGVVVAQNNTDYTVKQVRNVVLSTVDPTGGANGDIWIKYI